jgi:hypothetical protein
MDRIKSLAKIFFSLLAGASVLFSCSKIPNYPVEPQISLSDKPFDIYRNIISARSKATQDSVVVNVNFKDGDGDLGLDDNDKAHNPDSNYIAKLYEKKGKNFVPKLLPDSNGIYQPVVYGGFFQLLAPKNVNGPIDGVLRMQTIFEHPNYPFNDTLKFKIKIRDRAGHTSNEIESPIFVVRIK